MMVGRFVLGAIGIVMALGIRCAVGRWGGWCLSMGGYVPIRSVHERATLLHGFEVHWAGLLAAQARKSRRLCVRMGTVPAGQDGTIPIAEKAHDVFCPTVSGFGMTEVWALAAWSDSSQTREQYVYASGYPMNDYEFKIIDPVTGQEQPQGTPGGS